MVVTGEGGTCYVTGASPGDRGAGEECSRESTSVLYCPGEDREGAWARGTAWVVVTREGGACYAIVAASGAGGAGEGAAGVRGDAAEG